MRSWLGLALVVVFWQGCGRQALVDQVDFEPLVPGAAGSGATGGTGGLAGAGGATGGGGSSLAGQGGAGGGGGTGGGGAGGSLACIPGRSEACACPTGEQGAQVCQSNGTFAACVCVPSEFERVRKGIVGTWSGSDDTPWTDAYKVIVKFTADGHYSAQCLGSCPAPVFYWGIDDASPLKTYRLDDLQAGGAVTGDLTIFFGGNDVQTGAIEQLTLSPDGRRLHFEVWATWLGRIGPVVLDLLRQELI
jgi:hypothetical protein